MAIRSCYPILVQLTEAEAQRQVSSNQLRVEEARRTLWSCFLIESILGRGKLRSFSFHSSTLNVSLPASDEDFAFGTCQAGGPIFLEALDLGSSDPPAINNYSKYGSEPCFSLIIQGFNIWSAVSRWVSSGGRRTAPPASRDCPWRTGSPWNRGFVAIEEWRAAQSLRMHFSSTNFNLQTYILRNQGVQFAFINLIYFVTTIFLHREFIPFIPFQNQPPCGPSEPPLIAENPPPQWWESSARKLFKSASDVIRLMKQLVKYGIELQAPFTCFCVFNATTVLAYAKTWPHMALGEPDIVELYNWGAKWLFKASGVWEIARAWHVTLIEVDAFYNHHRRSARNITDREHRQLLQLRDRVERLAEPEASGSQEIPVEGNAQNGSGQQGRLTEPLMQDEPSTLSQEHSMHLDNSTLPWVFPTTRLDRSWPAIDDTVLDYDFMTNALTDPSGDFLIRMC